MQNNQLLWAIIDDGVNDHYENLVDDLEIDDEGNVYPRKNKSNNSHADKCVGIIHSLVGQAGHFVSIKVLDGDTQKGTIKQLLAALNWCLCNSVQLIHMSIGTIEPSDFKDIQYFLDEFARKKIWVVAANSNKGVQTYPAYHASVFGVEADREIKGNKFYYFPNAMNGIQFKASACHNIFCNQKKQRTPFSNSYAAPVLTAELLNIIAKTPHLERDRIMERLQKRARKTICDVDLHCISPKRNSAIVAFIAHDADQRQRVANQAMQFFCSEGFFCRVIHRTFPDNEKRTAYIEWATRFFPDDLLLICLSSMQERAGLEELIDLSVVNEDIRFEETSAVKILKVKFSNVIGEREDILGAKIKELIE